MVSSTAVKHVTAKQLHLDCLPLATRKAFLAIIQLPILKNPGWYLAGGTALTLQVGHRQSVDLDFFTTKKQFQIKRLETQLYNTDHWEST